MVFHGELFCMKLYKTHFGPVNESVMKSVQDDIDDQHPADVMESEPLSANIVLIVPCE